MTESAPELPKLPLPLRKQAAFKASWKPVLLNWLVPGLGYWMISEKTRAKALAGVWALFCVLAALQLHFGTVNGIPGGVFTPQFGPFEWMPNLGAAGTLGVGPVYAVFASLFGGPGSEPVRNLTQEYGASYLMVAGLLNWLACFDLFDRTTNRWHWRLPEDEQRELAERLNPTQD